MASAGSVTQAHQANRYGPLPLQLWKATVTVPAAATAVTVTSPNKLSGTVVEAWIDPTTLTASATVKVYDSTNDVMATTGPTYFVNYTAPDPAVESKEILSGPCLVMGTLSCVVASATAGDVFDIYIWVNPNALAPGTALIGKVRLEEYGRTRISKRVAISSSQTGATVWDPTTGTRFVLVKLIFSGETAGKIQFFDMTDAANTVLSPVTTISIAGGLILEWPPEAPYRSAAIDNILKYTTGTGVSGSVYVEGWEE